MNDAMSIQLAISKLHMHSLSAQQPSDTVATEALAELNTVLTELEATNDELRRSNDALAQLTYARDLEARRYRQLFEQIPVACVITDAWGVISECNAYAEALLNAPGRLLQGKPISVFVPPENRRDFRDQLRKLPITEPWELSFQPRERDRIDVRLIVVQLTSDEGSEPQLCIVIENVTPIRAAASTRRMLERETKLRLEAQSLVAHVRLLNAAMRHFAADTRVAIPQRVHTFLEGLVPRLATSISCQFPGTSEPVIVVGTAGDKDFTEDAEIYAAGQAPGRLVLHTTTRLSQEDAAIVPGIANAITALLAGAHSRFG